jgi:hypothetical protein
VAALAIAHAKALAVFLVLATIRCALPEGSSARALYCLLCGVLAVIGIFFATALWLVKKCPARTSAMSPDDGFVVRAHRWVSNLLARLRKASDATLRKWHIKAGAYSAPLAVVHASFRWGSLLTLALLLSLGFVLASGFLLAYQYCLLPMKGLASNPKASAAAKEAVERLDSSRRLDLTLHRTSTLVLWTILALHILLSSMF